MTVSKLKIVENLINKPFGMTLNAFRVTEGSDQVPIINDAIPHGKQ